MRGGNEVKYKLAKHTCIDRACGFAESDHKNPDARRCQKCGKQTSIEYIKKSEVK